jgi:Protein of unknown function (DUF1822)
MCLGYGRFAPIASVNPVQAENLLQRLAAASNPRLEIPFGLWAGLVSDRQWRQQLAQLQLGEAVPAANQLKGWLQNVFAAGWQAVEDFWGEDADLAVALRQTATAAQIVRRVKALELAERVLLLLVSIEADGEDRVVVQVQLRSLERAATLPPELTLSLLTNDDVIVRSVVTRDLDNAIGLPRFRSDSGTEFKIQVQLATTTLSESFLV